MSIEKILAYCFIAYFAILEEEDLTDLIDVHRLSLYNLFILIEIYTYC